MTKNFIICIAIFFAAVISVSAQKITGTYTDLSTKKCRTVETNQLGESYEGECKGVGGYKIMLLEGDLRQSLDVISPAKKRFELNFWNLFSGFSSIGEKAEWRMKGKKPIALIVRLNVSENPKDASILTSYLIVSKISPKMSCVTNVIKASANQNEIARQFADKALSAPCKKEL